MPHPDAMSCEITASFLDSGRVLAHAGNGGAILAGVGSLMVGSELARTVLAVSLLFWFVECYYAVRVSIDSSLFRVIAADPEESVRRLDEVLHRAERPLEDRRRGALGLWRKQRAALAAQLATLMAGIVLRIVGL